MNCRVCGRALRRKPGPGRNPNYCRRCRPGHRRAYWREWYRVKGIWWLKQQKDHKQP
jgi:hypothetical protein